MNKKIRIVECQSNIRLRSAEKKDIEYLRKWKNENTASFFYKEKITSEQQAAWFSAYEKRDEDYIFMVEELVSNQYVSIGCMGFRLCDDSIDLYNIIRGKESATKASMHRAMHMMLNYVVSVYNQPIRCDVLKDNPAVMWYKKCGFDILEEIEYYVMKIDRENILDIKILVNEEETL